MDIFSTYEQHFGFSGHPFATTPDPDFHFESRGHARALAYFQHAVRRGECFMVLTGDVGAGKTVLVRKLLRGLEAEGIVAALPAGTAFDARAVLLAILSAFHAPVHDESLDALRERLRAFLDTLSVVGRKGLVVLDEAQHLLPDAMEELISLATPRSDGRPAVQVLLAGQPELRGKLPPAMHLRREPCFFFCDLGLFSQAETRAYIEHRLRRVLWHQLPVFADDAHARIHQATGGVPRHINRLCHRLLMAAAQRQLNGISAQIVDETSASLREEMGDLVPPHIEAVPELVEAVPPAACLRARPARSAIPALYTPDAKAFDPASTTTLIAREASPAPIAEAQAGATAQPGATAQVGARAPDETAQKGAPQPIAKSHPKEAVAEARPVADVPPSAADRKTIAEMRATARGGRRPGWRTLSVAGGIAVLVVAVLLGLSAYLEQRSRADVAAAEAREDPAVETAADEVPAPEGIADRSTPTPGNGSPSAGDEQPGTSLKPPATTEAARPAAPAADAAGAQSAAAESVANVVGAAPAATAGTGSTPVAGAPVAGAPVAGAPVVADARRQTAQTSRATHERPRTTRRSSSNRQFAARAAIPSPTAERRNPEPRPSARTPPVSCTAAVAALGLCTPPRSP